MNRPTTDGTNRTMDCRADRRSGHRASRRLNASPAASGESSETAARGCVPAQRCHGPRSRMRELRTSGSAGAGGGQPPSATRPVPCPRRAKASGNGMRARPRALRGRWSRGARRWGRGWRPACRRERRLVRVVLRTIHRVVVDLVKAQDQLQSPCSSRPLQNRRTGAVGRPPTVPASASRSTARPRSRG